MLSRPGWGLHYIEAGEALPFDPTVLRTNNQNAIPPVHCQGLIQGECMVIPTQTTIGAWLRRGWLWEGDTRQ